MSSKPKIKKVVKPLTIEQQIRRRTLIAFTIFIACMAGGILGFAWIYNQPTTADNVQPILRKGFMLNERLFSLFYNKSREAKKYSKEDAEKKVRVNGNVGMEGALDTATWRLRVARRSGDTLLITLNDLKALPKTELIFDFKCVEGWSQVTWWGGVRFSDFMQHYNLAPQMGMDYVGMITPDCTYYVGNDMPSMLQPQTLLCYEMNGQPLPPKPGLPTATDNTGKIRHKAPETHRRYVLQQ